MEKEIINSSSVSTYQYSLKLLDSRGVSIDDIVEIVYELQCEYFPKVTKEECEYHIIKVLTKREVQHALITGVTLDTLAEKKMLEAPLLEMLIQDEPLYGIDEILALSIVNIYGSIGFTNYGYLDKTKPGIIEKLNNHENNQVNTFLDDLIGAIAAASSSRLAHNHIRTIQ